jgi:uncharacterized protein (DUF1697 family)
MPTHVALLRGINVGGRNKVAMAGLRELMTAAGHADVTTYIQSGNVVFTARETDPAAIADDLEQAIAQKLGVRAGVVVLSCAELAEAARDNPFTEEENPKLVHAVFLRGAPGPEAPQQIAAMVARARERGSRDRVEVVGRTAYLHTPGGLGRSELAALLLGRASSPLARGTARNWATVTKLLALCGC